MRPGLDPELDGLTERIIGAGFAVSNGLGHGFLEAVYRNALVEELRLSGLAVQAEKAFSVNYRDKRVGVYVADIVVADHVIVELKAVAGLADAHTAQRLNYLKGQPASRRSADEFRNAAPAMASRDPLRRRLIHAAQSAILVHPCQENQESLSRDVKK